MPAWPLLHWLLDRVPGWRLRPCLGGLCAALTCTAVQAAAPLTVCLEASPEGLDVTQYTSGVVDDAVAQTVFDQLVHLKPGSVEFGPALAERWAVSADGLQYTLQLRRGVAFHRTPWFTPTRTLNADDVLFSFRRFTERGGPWQRAAANGFIAWESFGMGTVVAALAKLDAYTVRFTLRRPDAAFLTKLAQFNTSSIYSEEYGRQLLAAGQPQRLDTQPVGTGPFMLRSWQKDAVLRLDAHPGYWGGAPAVAQLVFAITPDASVRVQRLKAGECLIGANLRADTVDALQGSSVAASGAVALHTQYISVNCERPFLSDRRFRTALRLAFDKKHYVQAVYGGKAQPAVSLLPPALWGRDERLADEFDPARARALVQASGYDGREFTLLARIGGSIDAKRAAELMQSDWARIGVRVKIRMMEWGELIKLSGRGDYDITFFGWAGATDPDGFLTPLLSCAAIAGGNNSSRWCSKPFDALLDAALATTDRARRAELYRQAQRLMHDDVALIPIAYPTDFVGLNRRVKGFVHNPTTVLDLRGVGVAE